MNGWGWFVAGMVCGCLFLFFLAGYGPEAISAEDKPNQTQSPFVCLSFLLWFHEFKKRE